MEVTVQGWPSLATPRLEAIGPIRHAMQGDGVQQLLVKVRSELTTPMALEVDQRLEGFQGLQGAFEAGGAWLDSMPGGGLSHVRKALLSRVTMATPRCCIS